MESQNTAYYRYICERIRESAGDRKIVFYGSQASFEAVFKEYQDMKPAFNLTALKEKVSDKVRLIDDINNKSDEYYIVILLSPTDNLRKKMKRLGYRDFKDCMFVERKRVVLGPKDVSYEDGYGNKVVNNCGFEITIASYVFNSQVIIGKGTTCASGAKISVWKGNSKLTIGEGCKLLKGEFLLSLNTEISIGNDVVIMEDYSVTCSRDTKIIVGDHTMMSREIRLRSGDGHAIFDMVTGKRTNNYAPDDPKSVVEIGRHVWLGWGAVVLGGSKIGNCCIIGAYGVFKGTLPDHCVAAGNPAKIIKRDINWSKSNFTENIDDCEPYLNEEE